MPKLHKTYQGLGTLIHLTLFGQPCASDLEQANNLIQHYESLFTINRPHSEIVTINQAAGRQPVQVSDATYALVKQAILLSRQNFGFNAFIGPLVKLWNIGFKNAHVPTAAQIQARLGLTNPFNCEFNDEQETIYLQKAGMQLDLGSIAKGYIADRIQDFWHSLGKKASIIDLGGNLLLMGASPLRANHQWSIGIQNPLAPRGQVLATVHLPACSAVTSGIYERTLNVSGHIYHHILNPQTGYPHVNNLSSVTVFSKYSLDDEIETTRLFFAGKPIKAWAQTNPNIYGAVFVTKNKKIILQKIPPTAVTLLDDHYQILK